MKTIKIFLTDPCQKPLIITAENPIADARAGFLMVYDNEDLRAVVPSFRVTLVEIE